MIAAELNIVPVILSGGAGTRLWPLSRQDKPKQFLKLSGDSTMLQATLQRVLGSDRYSPPIIVANAAHVGEIRNQVRAIGAGDYSLILEPAPRSTAAAIALAALHCNPDALILVMPSDHVIRDEQAFLEKVDRAAALAARDQLITFGITPTGPETGYGYIRPGDELFASGFDAAQFVEKPDRETAIRYCEAGYLWNAGIFLFRADAYLAALDVHAPAVLAACRRAMALAKSSDGALYPDAEAFAAAPSISIDYAVMEKAERVAVVPLDVGWSDIGSWDALYDHLGDASGGEGIVEVDTSGCLIRTDGPTVAAIGVRDLIIVATREGVLVVPRGQSQRVKEALSRIGTAK